MIQTQNDQSEAQNKLTEAFGFVGDEECRETVWPNVKSRPSKRKFDAMKAAGEIPFIKSGKLCWYQPRRVIEALLQNNTVRPKWKPGRAKS